MRYNDYDSIKKAQNYHSKRFGKGLHLVSKDELDLIGQWISEVTNNKPAVYIDVGAGTGRGLGQLLNHSPKKIFALDPSGAMLNQLKLNYKTTLKNKIVQTITANSDKIPLPNSSVDIAISLHLFKHIPNTESTLREINRVLKKDGYFMFDILNNRSIIRFNLGTCYTLGKSEIVSKLNNNGFRIMKIVELHILGETIYNFIGSNIIHGIDKFITKISLGFATKFFILARKYE